VRVGPAQKPPRGCNGTRDSPNPSKEASSCHHIPLRLDMSLSRGGTREARHNFVGGRPARRLNRARVSPRHIQRATTMVGYRTACTGDAKRAARTRADSGGFHRISNTAARVGPTGVQGWNSAFNIGTRTCACGPRPPRSRVLRDPLVRPEGSSAVARQTRGFLFRWVRRGHGIWTACTVRHETSNAVLVGGTLHARR